MAPFAEPTTLTIEPADARPWEWAVTAWPDHDISDTGTAGVLEVLADPGAWMRLPAASARLVAPPKQSYTIWFSQRTGSTLLCKALESTGVAGMPNEWLTSETGSQLYDIHGVKSAAALQAQLWRIATSPNGVCGIKYCLYEPHFSQVLDILRHFPGVNGRRDLTRAQIWDNAFPNGKHIFLTRRNKARLAVSWWKAVQTQVWHREHGRPPQSAVVNEKYNYQGIYSLYLAATLREAGIQEYFTEAGISPLTLVYEDFIADYEGTVRRVLDYLEIPRQGVTVEPPYFGKLSDRVSDEWVERFRQDMQVGWSQRAW